MSAGVNAEVRARTWPLAAIGLLGLVAVLLLIVNAAVAVARSGDPTVRGILGGNVSIFKQVADTDLTPRPATLERVWSESHLFGQTFHGRLTDGRTLTLVEYSGEKVGDDICVGIKHSKPVQVVCAGVK